MTLREFWRFHFLKALLGLVVVQLAIVGWLQVRNHMPVAVEDKVSMVEGQSVKIQPLRNDTDKDTEDVDSLRIVQVGESLHGTLSHKGKYLHYHAEYGFVGVDSFTYIISDGKKQSDAGFIKITINKNLEPVASNDIAQLYAGRETMVDILANDYDRENDSIFIVEHTDPLHGELIKRGNQFVYKSKSTKSVIDSFTYILSDGFSKSEIAVVTIDVKDKTYSFYPWLSCDVGNVEIPGNIQKVSNKLLVESSGSDIWSNRDGMHYVYQKIKGDGQIVAKVEKLEGTHEWAKAGVMFRETLSGGSRNVTIGLSNKNGAYCQNRNNTDEYTNGLDKNPEVEAPYWLKLVRKGNSYTSFISENGKKWEEVKTLEVTMNETVYFGIAVTSHDNGELAKAVISNVSIKGKILR